MTNIMYNAIKKLYQAQDPAGLGIARFLFGFIMIIDIFDERGLLYIPEKWGDPDSCYFPLFENLPRLSIEYMHVVYLILLLSAIGIMIGFLYRISCFCFMISYWYVFFLDKTVWNNHSYLYGLMSLLFFLTNAHYYWSVDGLLWPSIRNTNIPLWNYGVFRFQMFLLYFYAGLKKLDQDWVAGYSMSGLSRKWIFDPFRVFLSDDLIDYIMVHWGGLFFDLSQGFLLLFDQTRIIGVVVGYGFHGMNAVMFNIGMFSYACMAMMLIFCRPDWPKKLIKAFPMFLQLFLPITTSPQKNVDCSELESLQTNEIRLAKDRDKQIQKDQRPWSLSLKNIFMSSVVLLYIVIQLVLPYSHSVTKGYNSWTQGLYGYSWDMMVHSWNTQHVVVKVVDAKTGKKQYLRPGAFFPTGNDRNRIFSHPDMMKQYAVCLSDRIVTMPDLQISHPQIYFDVWKSLNNRYQQRMLDPRVDIASAPWSPFVETSWLRPLLVELTPWRSTLAKIRSINTAYNNATDIVFVADFPGLYLENYIAAEIAANVTVLSGSIVVDMDGVNVSATVNETITLKGDVTHTVYTVSENPSCYMYVYYNTTWVEQTEEELIKSDPVLQKQINARDEWNKLPALQKLSIFLSKKFNNYRQGLWQIYFAISVIFDVGYGANEGVPNDEL